MAKRKRRHPAPPPADVLARWDAQPAKWWYYSRDVAAWVDCDAEFAAEACAMGWRVKLASEADHASYYRAASESEWTAALSLVAGFRPNIFDARWESQLAGLGERPTTPTIPPIQPKAAGPTQRELF